MISCAIIDDDEFFTRILEHYILQVDFLKLQQVFHDSTRAINEIDQKNTDLIFLDMKIPQMHGLEFIEALNVKPEFVFVSGSKTYGPEAFEHNALDYLHKPVSLSRFFTDPFSAKPKTRAARPAR